MKTVCVFCGSSNDLNKKYYKEASVLGELLGKNSYSLIHGGGIIGLMGHLLKAAIKTGSKVTGVVPEKLNKPNIANSIEQKLIVTSDMKSRKEFMRENSDAFIALPGGFGTLEEVMEVITLKQLKYHTKPVVIVNTDNFYNYLFMHFEKIFSQNFANPEYNKLYYIAKNSKDAIDYIKNYSYTNIYDKYLNE